MSGDLLLRRLETEQGDLVVACDAELLGQRFEDDGVVLDLTGEFYDGEPVEAVEVEEALRAAGIANLVGERSVEAGVDAGAIDLDLVLEVEGVPHGQMVRI